MSISDREMESFNQKTHEIMESLKVSQKRLEEMIVTLKGPLGTARMNSNTEEIKNLTEIMDNLKKVQRSMIADSNCLSFIKDDLETAKETADANTTVREEQERKDDTKDDSVSRVLEGLRNSRSRRNHSPERREERRNDTRSERGHERSPKKESNRHNHGCKEEKNSDRRSHRDDRRSGNHTRRYEGERKDDRRSGNHQRQYEGERRDDRRSGDQRGNHPRRYEEEREDNRRSYRGGRGNHQRR